MKFIFVAKERKKPAPYFPFWGIIVIFFLASLGLYLLFPQQLFNNVIQSHIYSLMRLDYLHAYLAKHPKDMDLTLKTMENEIYLGHLNLLDADINQLKKIYQDSPDKLESEILWLKYLATKYRLSKVKHNMHQQVDLLSQLRALIASLAEKPLDGDQLQLIAHDALAYGQPYLALNIYLHLLQQNKLLYPQEFIEGANIAIQNNRPDLSVIFYQRAYYLTKNPVDKSTYALNVMSAWWAANQPHQALSFALSLPSTLKNQPTIEIQIARLALATNQPDLAETYIYRALSIHLNDLDSIQKRLTEMINNDELFQLLYETSLYNEHLESAYKIAQIAMDRNPDALIWHQRFAEVALWNSHTNQAIQEWLYLFQHFPQKAVRAEAIKVTKTMGFDQVLCQMLNIELKTHPHHWQAALELASAYNRLGEPQKALFILNNVIIQAPRQLPQNAPILRKTYALKATIYQDTEAWDKALKTYQERDRYFGYDTDSVMAQASIYYKFKDLKRAEDILKKAMSTTSRKNDEYWRSLGELAWLLNDRQTAITAYSFYQDPPSTSIQLIELYRISNPQHALELSLQNFKTYPLNIFLGNALVLIANLKDWPNFLKLLPMFTPKTQIMAEKMPLYWELMAKFYGVNQRSDYQEAVLQYAITHYSQMPSLKSDLFWLYLSQGDSDHICQLLEQWYPNELSSTPLLWYPIAEGFKLENQLNLALLLYQQNLFKDTGIGGSSEDLHTQLQAIIDYANLLTAHLNNKEAYATRISLWAWILHHLPQIRDPLIAHQLLAQLASFEVSGTEQLWLNIGLLQDAGDDQSLLLSMNLFSQQNMIDWVIWIKNNYPQVNVPDRIKLAIALAKNDTQTLQDIQAKPKQTKPRTEHIQAAIRLENTAAAETLMFKEMQERPEADEVYQTFVPLALNDANKAGILGAYEQFINIAGPRVKIESTQKLTNEWKIKPFVTLWNAKSQDTSQIINVPHDRRAGIQLQQTIHRGKIQYEVLYRDALSQFVPVDLELTYQVMPRWQMILNAGVNQENFQTSYMRIGGVQDQLNAKLIGQLDPYTLLYTEIEGVNYYSQNRHYLGDGLDLHGALSYKFWLGYPDYTLGAFTDLYFLSRNGTFGGNTVNLFPPFSPIISTNPSAFHAAQEANYLQLVPNSYYQGGVQFSFGDNIQEYSARLRPFFVGRLYYNTLTKLSNEIKAGINMTVFGRDSLLIYAEHGTAPAVANATTETISARYVAYF